MRRFPTILAPILILAVALLASVSARDGEMDPIGPAPAPKGLEPPVEVDGPARRGPDDDGSTNGFFVDNYPNMASFFFSDKPPICHFTFLHVHGMGVPTPRMFRDRVEFVGPDGTGHYWHYRSLKPEDLRWHAPYPTDWYFPKPKFSATHLGVWYKTDEPWTKLVYYGRPIQFLESDEKPPVKVWAGRGRINHWQLPR